MTDQIKSNPELDEAINGAQSGTELRERMLSILAAQGIVVRSRTDEFDNRVIHQPPTPGAPLPASEYRFERVVNFAESTGKRSLLIKANTIQDLNELERRVVGG